MPRARTKFVWPPPTNMPDSEPTPTEPPPKRQRMTTASRGRRAVGEIGKQSHEALSGSDREERCSSQSQPAGDSYGSAPSPACISPAAVPDLLAAALRRYQDWRRNGALHDDVCFVCHRPKDLLPCDTCRRSYHEGCVPSGQIAFRQPERDLWYCPVCVQRNWHINPPTMTPPASPRLLPQHPLQDVVPQPQQSANDIPTPDRARRASGAHSTPRDQQALSILAEISRSLSRDSPSKSTVEGVTCSLTASQHVPPSLPSTRITSTSRRNESCETSSPSSQPPSFSLLDSHARKSRFATLSSEVDSALWVLYRELESAHSLRQKIAELEAQIVKLRQEVSIRDNQLILSRRAVKAGQVPQAEIDRLRVEAAKAEAATRDTEALRARNEALEKELTEARAETETMSGTLNEWKGKLINLIGS